MCIRDRLNWLKSYWAVNFVFSAILLLFLEIWWSLECHIFLTKWGFQKLFSHSSSSLSTLSNLLTCYGISWNLYFAVNLLLAMSLSSSYQFPHGSVIKFCQFPCSAVFVVDEMTCTLGGKNETAPYLLGVSICKQPLWMRFEPKQGWALWLGTTTSPRPPHSQCRPLQWAQFENERYLFKPCPIFSSL